MEYVVQPSLDHSHHLSRLAHVILEQSVDLRLQVPIRFIILGLVSEPMEDQR
jgi:hypothetical protein